MVFLLGIWGQAAGACPEAHAKLPAAQPAIEITVSVPKGFVAFGGENRCECPAAIQNAQALVSETDKSLLAACAVEAGAFLNSSHPKAAALAERSRASVISTRPSRHPTFLLVSRLLL